MQILISCAKTMGRLEGNIPFTSQPAFAEDAVATVQQLAAMTAEDLQVALHTTPKIAAENVLRYGQFLMRTMHLIPHCLLIQVSCSSRSVLKVLPGRKWNTPRSIFLLPHSFMVSCAL